MAKQQKRKTKRGASKSNYCGARAKAHFKHKNKVWECCPTKAGVSCHVMDMGKAARDAKRTMNAMRKAKETAAREASAAAAHVQHMIDQAAFEGFGSVRRRIRRSRRR